MTFVLLCHHLVEGLSELPGFSFISALIPLGGLHSQDLITSQKCHPSGIKFSLWIMWGHKHSAYALLYLISFGMFYTFQETLILLGKGIIKLIYKYHYHRTPIINYNIINNFSFNSMTFPIIDCHCTTISNKWFPNTGVFYIWQKIKIHFQKRSDLKSDFFSTSQKFGCSESQNWIQSHLLHDLNSLGIFGVLFSHFTVPIFYHLLYWSMSSEETGKVASYSHTDNIENC